MMDKDLRYGDAALRARESYSNKFRAELNKNATDSARRLMKLIERIPHWESYLTDKQKEAASRYVKTYNAYEVDYQLKLTPGTTHQRLFGNKSSSGAIGRLERAHKFLEESGFFEKLERTQEQQNAEARTNRALSEKVVSSVRELLQLTTEIDYRHVLNDTQLQQLSEFMRLRSFRMCAAQLGISEVELRHILIGKDGNGGILAVLREEYTKHLAHTWEEL